MFARRFRPALGWRLRSPASPTVSLGTGSWRSARSRIGVCRSLNAIQLNGDVIVKTPRICLLRRCIRWIMHDSSISSLRAIGRTGRCGHWHPHHRHYSQRDRGGGISQPSDRGVASHACGRTGTRSAASAASPPSSAIGSRSAGARATSSSIVDEGPGLSGSSFLSVANALQVEGVDPEISSSIAAVFRRLLPFAPRPAAKSGRAFRPPLRCRARYQKILKMFRMEDCAHTSPRRTPSCQPRGLTWSVANSYRATTRSCCKFEGHGKYGDAACERARKLAARGLWAAGVGQG